LAVVHSARIGRDVVRFGAAAAKRGCAQPLRWRKCLLAKEKTPLSTEKARLYYYY